LGVVARQKKVLTSGSRVTERLITLLHCANGATIVTATKRSVGADTFLKEKIHGSGFHFEMCG
jgi:hypothetical protein